MLSQRTRCARTEPAMKTKFFLMGSEVEYSMSGPQRHSRYHRGRYHELLLAEIQKTHRWLTDIHGSNGIYLDNGARYYLDSGYHNEFSSPEVYTPRQIATYDRAAERILLRAKAAVKASAAGLDLCITKNNLNFHLPDRAAWGQHEAYTCWVPLETAAEQLIPHLVSRLPYAGAGCLSAAAGGGFELSQRSRHILRETGPETTQDRAIFCTRAWKSSDVSPAGWTRTNLICKDSQRCSFGMYLSFAATGLLFLIVNEGHRVGRDVQLKNPVAAMRAFSIDPWCRTAVPLANGRQATLLDIQRAYVHEVQPYVESGDFPDWTYEAFRHWSVTLDELELNPLQLANRLDPYLKWQIFDRQLARVGMDWHSLRQALQMLYRFRRISTEDVLWAVLEGDGSELSEKLRTDYDRIAKLPDFRRMDPGHLGVALRMQALELRYHELGGLFEELAAAGRVDAVAVNPQDVEQAVHQPPDGGRAASRSRIITKLHGKPWSCDWQYVVNANMDEWFDLRDPFSPHETVTSVPADLSVAK